MSNSSIAREGDRSPSPPSSQAPSWVIKLLYDGDCPLCVREVNFLRTRDAGRGRVAFVNIAADDYDPDANGGIDYATAMGRIHAVRVDGTVLQNIEVFRQIYDVLGMGWLYAPTRWPVIGGWVDWVYRLWAGWRLALTGRPDLATLVAQRQARIPCTAGCQVTSMEDDRTSQATHS